MTIVTRKDLMQPAGEGYGRNLTITFLRKHDREIGGRGKPRRYDLAVVDAFLHRFFREKLERTASAEAHAGAVIREIDTIVARRGIYPGMDSRRMVGRGGRTEAAR